MCIQCWEEHGRPALDSPAIRAAAEAIGEVNPYGNLHIIVDDWNLEDEHLDFCRAEVDSDPYDHYTRNPSDRAVDSDCLRLLAALTIEERASALARHDGFIGREEDG
jgi:hypothetical protein